MSKLMCCFPECQFSFCSLKSSSKKQYIYLFKITCISLQWQLHTSLSCACIVCPGVCQTPPSNDHFFQCCCVFTEPYAFIFLPSIVWLSLTTLCMSSIAHSFDILYFCVYVRRYNTEGFCVRFPLSVSRSSRLMVEANILGAPWLHSVLEEFLVEMWRQPLGLHWRPRFLLFLGGLCFWSSSAGPHTHTEKALSEQWCTQGVLVWMSSLWLVLEKMDEHVWCL